VSPRSVWSALARRVSEVIAACAPGQVLRLRRQLGEATIGMRVTIAALAISGLGLVGILTREGYSSVAYPDPAKGAAVATIGFGSTEGVKLGDKTDPVSAVNRALREVQAKESAIKRCAPDLKLTQYEYDAYIELAHNIGEGAFCRSSIVRAARAGDYARACDHILDWKYVTVQGPLGPTSIDCSKPNKVCSGLWKDRLRLHAKCKGTA